MNNTKIVIAILALVLGLVLIGAGFALVKGNFSAFNSSNVNFEEHIYEADGKINDLDILEHSEQIEVYTSDVDRVKITYYVPEGQDDDVIIKESGGKLSYKRSDKPHFYISIGINFTDTTTVVELPKDYKGEIKAKASSGSIKAYEIDNEADFEVSSTSGSINVSDIECKAFTVTASSGSVSCGDIECDDALVKASSGSVKVKNMDAKGSVVTIGATSGSVSVEELVAKEVSVTANSGSVRMNKVECDTAFAKTTSGSLKFEELKADEITLKNTSGGIRGTIDGKEEDYSIISSTTSGSNNLTNSRSGSKTLDVSTTSGSIRVEFR